MKDVKKNPKIELIAAITAAAAGCTALLVSGGMYTQTTRVYKTSDGYEITTSIKRKVRPLVVHEGQPLQRIGLAIASFGLCLGSHLMMRRLEDEINFASRKSKNVQARAQHYEELKNENAIHRMNMDSQISRAMADFDTRMQIAALRQEYGYDLHELASEELENQMFAEEQQDVEEEPGEETLEQLCTRALDGDFYSFFTNLRREEKEEAVKILAKRYPKRQIIHLCWRVQEEDDKARYEDAKKMLSSMLGETTENSAALSEQAQRLMAYLKRKEIYSADIALSSEKVRASGCVKDADTATIRDLFAELVQAEKAELDDKGNIYLI